MTPEGHNDLFPAIEAALKASAEPLDCNELFDMEAIRSIAPSANRVSDYLGVLFRRGLVSRIANERTDTGRSKARWKYLWKQKEMPAWRKDVEIVEYKPKAILDRPNIYISEDGNNINIELPHLSITIKKK